MEFLVLIKTRYSNIFDFVQQDDKINRKRAQNGTVWEIPHLRWYIARFNCFYSLK